MKIAAAAARWRPMYKGEDFVIKACEHGCIPKVVEGCWHSTGFRQEMLLMCLEGIGDLPTGGRAAWYSATAVPIPAGLENHDGRYEDAKSHYNAAGLPPSGKNCIPAGESRSQDFRHQSHDRTTAGQSECGGIAGTAGARHARLEKCVVLQRPWG